MAPAWAFRADVAVSSDASRMSGTFVDAGGQTQSSSWLRLHDDQTRLPSPAPVNDPMEGDYVLRLVESASPGSTYDAQRTYHLSYRADAGLFGDLGAFFSAEVSRSADPGAPIQVGPVPATDPMLPVAMTLDHDAMSLTRLTARNASGIVSTFDATRAS
jgi:hypothetical protein